MQEMRSVAEVATEAEANNMKMKIPKLVGHLSESGASINVWCPFCKRNHVHGAASMGHRVAHCTDVNSPFLVTGYDIGVDPTLLTFGRQVKHLKSKLDELREKHARD